MELFRKATKEDENQEDNLGDRTFRKKPETKDFKDLNPKNRKKRKEPKKPWSKKERIIILCILALTAGMSGVLALSSRSWKLPGLPRFDLNLRRIQFPFSGEETIIIEGKKINELTAQAAVSGFSSLTKNLSGVYGLYVIDISNGATFGVNENEEFEPASLNKLSVVLGLYMEAEAGNLDLGTKYTLKNSDKLKGSGSLYSRPAGMVLTYRELIQYMCKESDNTAFNIVRRILGEDKIRKVINTVGMTGTIMTGEDQKTTPKDIGLYFQRLYDGGLISNTHRDEFLNYLTDTIYEDHVVAGVPDDIKVAHKYGRELHVINDAGIVFSQNPYVVVILSKGIVEKEADYVYPQISKLIYEVFVKYSV